MTSYILFHCNKLQQLALFFQSSSCSYIIIIHVPAQRCISVMKGLNEEQKEFFFTQGYVVLRSFLTEKEIDVLEKRCELYSPDPSLITQYAQENDQNRFEFSLTQSLPAEILAKRKMSCSDDSREEGESYPYQLHRLTDVINILCPELRPAEAFCIVSKPGSRDQVQHTDSIPMEGQSDASWASTLHYIGALIPLQDTNEKCGQTAVIPASHINSEVIEEISISMNLGDVLLMDGRTTHRGLANKTSAVVSCTRENMHDTSRNPCSSLELGITRKMCFFTFVTPGVMDGNALAYVEKDKDNNSKNKRAKI